MSTSDVGLDGFVAALRRYGLEPLIEADVVTFEIEPINGAHAGRPLATGVSVEELVSWPAVPPHWVHFPCEVTFSHSNTQPSSRAGLTKHSRQISRWGNAAEPVHAWLAHARGVAGEAVT
jgi:hypothetical protein